MAEIQVSKSNFLLEVKNLKKYFPIQKGKQFNTGRVLKAVDDVSFFVEKGETISLIGEAGCGKTTTVQCINRLVDPTEGKVLFQSALLKKPDTGHPVDLTKLGSNQLFAIRQEISMVFQDPAASLNARLTVEEIVAEPLMIHHRYSKDELREKVLNLLEQVGLHADHLHHHPEEFTSGQCQRIAIARALSLSPRLVIYDEPVSALDFSIKAETLKLLNELKQANNLTYILTANGLEEVHLFSNRIAILYAGKIVETAAAEELIASPFHPYTETLVTAIPKADRLSMPGPSLINGVNANSDAPSGCYFHPRCRYAMEQCKIKAPALSEHKKDHFVACHRAEELHLQGI